MQLRFVRGFFAMPENLPPPSDLGDADIERFRELFKTETGVTLSFPEARDYLRQLVHLAELFTSIPPNPDGNSEAD
jgi:hypothetical protein